MPDTTTETRAGFAPSVKEFAALRGHIVHTEVGKLAGKPGARPTPIHGFVTTADDVRRIVHENLALFIETSGRNYVPVLIWPHGGLVSKQAGFEATQDRVDWWKNRVGPIQCVTSLPLHGAATVAVEA